MSNTKLFLNLFRNAETVSFSAGQSVFSAADKGPAMHMYVIIEGQVEIQIDTKMLELLGPGEIFGEMALIDDGPRSAAAVAKTDCRMAAVNRRRFEFMVQETPFFALAVMQVLADRLRRTDARVASS
ncbi:MAG: cyclic nucleotide-binding domain-containing protein [Bryobacteraceae bacterium]|jgi:CRP-like cAMP-binding protein